jgi:ABC-2 type transport system permease protein
MTSPATPVRLTRRPEFGALTTLFMLTLRQHVRGRRLMIAMLLFLLPTVFALLVRGFYPDFPRQHLAFALIFNLIPHGLLPLAALLYSSGMIQDELEEQTLTYLLIRPLPRWGIYLAKLLATLVVTTVLSSVFTLVTYAAIYWGSENFWTQIMPRDAGRTAAIFALALCAYCTFFGWTSLLVRRSFILGVGYIIIFEGVIANVDFAVRKITIMYYLRVLAQRWLDFTRPDWSIDLTTAATASECVWTLAIASLAFTLLAIVSFTTREWRVKTPEGS